MTNSEGLQRAWNEMQTVFIVHTRCSVYGLRLVAGATADLVFWATDKHTEAPLHRGGGRLHWSAVTAELCAIAGALFSNGKSFEEARETLRKEAWLQSVTL